MKLKGILYCCFFVLCSRCVGCDIEHKNVYKAVDHRNLIIIQDHYTEKAQPLSACTVVLLRALQSEVAPILVSTSVWYSACEYLDRHGNEHFLKPKRHRWNVYVVNKHLYLAVPIAYQETVTNKFSFVRACEPISTSNGITTQDLAVGLKLSRLKVLENPFECSFSRSAKNTFQAIGSCFTGDKTDVTTTILKNVLVTKDDCDGCLLPLDIFLTGHGRAKNKAKQIRLAGFSLEEFRSFLTFLNNEVSTRLLIYQTCYGGGNMLKIPYTTDGMPDRYAFDIISCCATNSAASVIYNPFSQNNIDFCNLLKASDDQSEIDSQLRVSSYFPASTDSARKRILENVPFIRPKGARAFNVCKSPQSTVRVYEKGQKGVELYNTQLFFIPHDLKNVSIAMKDKCSAIISQDGDETITIKKLEACDQLLDDIVLYCFFPVTLPGCPVGNVFIKELICKRTKNDNATIRLQNVKICSYRSSRKTSNFQDLSLNGQCNRIVGFRKKITYEHEGRTYTQDYRPQKRSSFKDFCSFLWTSFSFAKTGAGVFTGNPLSIASLPMSLMSVGGNGGKSQYSVKSKKSWHISKAKVLSQKKAVEYKEWVNHFYS